MANIVLGMVILAILGFAIGYIVKEKKRGTKCIGCPYSGGSCSCGSSSCESKE